MARPDPQLLLTWTVVARMGGINAAADVLGLTQPAVSNQLRRLQDWLGEPLYRRHGRGVTPTALGKRLLRIASQIEAALADAETLQSDVQDLMQGSLLLVASQTNAEFLLLRAMAAFQKHYPMITVRLQSGNSEEARRRVDVADLAFVEDTVLPETAHGIKGKTLIETDIRILLSADHPLAQRPEQEPVALGELAGMSVVWREPGSGTRDRVEIAFRQAGLEPEIRYEFSAGAAVREAVRCGLGVGFVSALSATPADLCTRPVTPRIVQTLSVIYQGPLSRPGEAFLAVLDDMMRAGVYASPRGPAP